MKFVSFFFNNNAKKLKIVRKWQKNVSTQYIEPNIIAMIKLRPLVLKNDNYFTTIMLSAWHHRWSTKTFLNSLIYFYTYYSSRLISERFSQMFTQAIFSLPRIVSTVNKVLPSVSADVSVSVRAASTNTIRQDVNDIIFSPNTRFLHYALCLYGYACDTTVVKCDGGGNGK